MFKALTQFWRNDSGATAIEYGLIAALMAVACIAAFIAFGGSLGGLFGSVNTKTTAAIGS